ncbi:spore coat protein CotJB [Saliterribacillus persicus]|uniref:Spore coat protein JB n=1 Tax=Saliterribacillus persicus TaxID=930114 RepID=A0A368XEJ3_9BACI|nr:spore coat protein CotJB [Saliterribacillus persicus]RCW64887.1 spore coat protein JB [Saliterribacillus persicus]
MNQQKELPKEFYELLEQIQAVDFVLVELTLYLDTHPNDLDAIKQFNNEALKSKKLKDQYEAKYGPLMQYGKSFSYYPWNWDDAPWPWQI